MTGSQAQRLVLTADTHLPGRARDLPAELWAAIAEADVVLHAGDWVDAALLDALEEVSPRVIGVWGNNDGADLRSRLDEVVRVELAGVRFAMVHETGPARGREQRCAEAFPDVDVLVFGHSHIPWDTTAPGGLRLLNPGSPTDRRRQPYCTFMTVVVGDGEVQTVELHRLPPRGTAGRSQRANARRLT
jgi:uncharacterized protein